MIDTPRVPSGAEARPSSAPALKLKEDAVASAKAFLPDSIYRWLRSASLGQPFKRAKHSIDLGDLRRKTPISKDFGYDRGDPVDRYYIEKFLQAHSHLVRGHVLEISENTYTRKYGGTAVGRSDVLHYNDPAPPATMTGDLSNAPHLPSNTFDCIILTQTLMYIYHVPNAVATLHRILKPGGAVLATVAGLSQTHPSLRSSWHWGFTVSSARRLFEDGFPSGEVDVRSYGNVLSSIAFLTGLAQDELSPSELEFTDPDYQLIVAVVAQKSNAEFAER